MAGIGEILQDARERRGVTFEEVAEATKIKKRFLLAMELEEWGRLPGKVYARGFLRAYARFLDLDEQSLCDLFELSLSVKETEKSEPSAPTGTRRRGRRRKPQVAEKPKKVKEIDLRASPKRSMIIILCILSVILVVFYVWAYDRYYLEEAEATKPVRPPIVQPQPEPGDDIPEPVQEEPPEPVTFTSFAVKLEATENCWLRLKDGETLVYENTMRKGETLEFEDLSTIYIRLGNAGGVKLNLNGIDLPPLGGLGQIATKNFSILDGVMYDDETGEALS